MRKGALDISLYPLPYAGGELPETNIGLMPGLVTTYEQGMRWKKEPIGKALTDFLADKGIILLTWVWQAGGVASRSRADRRAGRRQGPQGSRRLARNGHGAADRGRGRAVGAVERNLFGDADRRVRRRHHLVDQLDFLPAGGSREVPHTGRQGFLLVHDGAADDVEIDLRRLPKKHQDIIMAVGAEMEAFGLKGAQADDVEVAKIYEKAGAKVSDARRNDRRQMARHRPRYRLEGLRRQDRALGQPFEARVRRLRMMHGPLPDQQDTPTAAPSHPLVAAVERGLALATASSWCWPRSRWLRPA